MALTIVPWAAKAEPQVLTDAQMDAVTAAAGVVHLNMPTITVIVLNVPDIQVIANIDLGDIIVENRNVVGRNVITQVAVATSVGISICGVCLGGFPQVAASAFAFNSQIGWPGLP
jgi:hypothetical protein